MNKPWQAQPTRPQPQQAPPMQASNPNATTDRDYQIVCKCGCDKITVEFSAYRKLNDVTMLQKFLCQDCGEPFDMAKNPRRRDLPAQEAP